MKWFTSDLHLGHDNICLGSTTWTDHGTCRPFKNAKEMDECFLDAINSKVGIKDTLYHLGDFTCGTGDKIEATQRYRRLIKCRNVVYIYGNHDLSTAHEEFLKTQFSKVAQLLVIQRGKQKIVLCHYAMRTWQFQAKGGWQLHGHSHQTLPTDSGLLQMDVGVDYYGTRRYPYTWEPLSLEHVKWVMDSWKAIQQDYHTATPT